MVIVSAGDALTARLVEESGFDGIWVSGFEVTARMGLPDNGSLTMTEMLYNCKPIVEAVKIPVYVDVDTGYGNFRRTVKEFEKIGVAGICVEDNLPDKENSLWGGKRPIMDAEEFADKIRVPHKLTLIARTEALIRGYDDVWDRIKRYWGSGADIILPHSRTEPMEVTIPKKPWYIDYAIVPTKFPHYTNKRLKEMGYKMVIWANQTERVKIKAIREALKILKEDDCAVNIENKLSATLDDMRGLIND